MNSRRIGIIGLIILLGLMLSACGGDQREDAAAPAEILPAETTAPEEVDENVPFALTSPAFESGDSIPVQYSCDGEDISPPLEWVGAPGEGHGFALIMDDPDAPSGTWVHWVVYNMASETRSLAEGIPPGTELDASGAFHGVNSWGNLGYGGPCPPGGTHRYIFTLYALDQLVELPAEATKEELLAAMEGHIIEEVELMGTFSR